MYEVFWERLPYYIQIIRKAKCFPEYYDIKSKDAYYFKYKMLDLQNNSEVWRRARICKIRNANIMRMYEKYD